MSKPTVAVIGPLPPPIHGHVVSTQRLLTSQLLTSEFRVVHVDASDHRDFENLGKLELRNLVLAMLHTWRLAVVLVRERPSIVYVPLAQNTLGLGRDLLFVALGLLGRARIVAHVHGGGFGSFLEDSRWLFRTPAMALLRRCAALVVMSDWQREWVESMIPADRVVVVRHGTESVDVPPHEPEGGPLRALCVSSRLDAEKGIDTLLEAASSAQRAGITASWDIVGMWTSRHARAMGEAILDGVAGVRFRGALSREQLADAYADADVFVFPSRAPEGFALVRIEAMAAGLPVITTEAGGAREIVREGVDGFIVDDDSPRHIVRCLEELRSDPKRRVEMGRSAQARQRALFSDGSFEEAMANVWRNAARRDARFAGDGAW